MVPIYGNRPSVASYTNAIFGITQIRKHYDLGSVVTEVRKIFYTMAFVSPFNYCTCDQMSHGVI